MRLYKKQTIWYYVYDRNEVLISSSRMKSQLITDITIPIEIFFDRSSDYRNYPIALKSVNKRKLFDYNIIDMWIDDRDYGHSIVSFFHVMIDTTIEEL